MTSVCSRTSPSMPRSPATPDAPSTEISTSPLPSAAGLGVLEPGAQRAFAALDAERALRQVAVVGGEVDPRRRHVDAQIEVLEPALEIESARLQRHAEVVAMDVGDLAFAAADRELLEVDVDARRPAGRPPAAAARACRRPRRSSPRCAPAGPRRRSRSGRRAPPRLDAAETRCRGGRCRANDSHSGRLEEESQRRDALDVGGDGGRARDAAQDLAHRVLARLERRRRGFERERHVARPRCRRRAGAARR